jgi:hypothetical protein
MPYSISPKILRRPLSLVEKRKLFLASISSPEDHPKKTCGIEIKIVAGMFDLAKIICKKSYSPF